VSTGTDEATGALDAVLRFDAAFGLVAEKLSYVEG
jgi:hypothetical protein